MNTGEVDERTEIALLIGHCQVYLYGAQGSAEMMINPVAMNFYSFAMLHLISTMFIVKDSRKETTGGVFHRTLDKLGLSELMSDIDSILLLPVGKNTLTEYIRQNAYPVISEHVKIELSELGDDIHLLGAYALILENLFQLITDKKMEDSGT